MTPIADTRAVRYVAVMNCVVRAVALVCTSLAIAATSACAQPALPDSLRTTGGLSLGISGVRSNDGTTVVGDLVWVGAEMTDGIGLRVVRQGLAPGAHGYAAMIVIGGPPRDSLPWLRLDFGMGYVGQQSTGALKFYQRHGIGAQLAMTVAPIKLGIVRPELNGWAIVGTSARFLGASLGLRILDPRQR
jgi:hypothetical protein